MIKAKYQGGVVNGNAEGRAGVGDLQRADGKVQNEQRSAAESGSVQEQPERPDELGVVQSVRDRVQLKHKKTKG